MLTQYCENKDLDNPLTSVYFSSYDIKCTELCPENCKDSIEQFRCNLGTKIIKKKLIGQGAQGKVR
jgi:hypothetical protein